MKKIKKFFDREQNLLIHIIATILVTVFGINFGYVAVCVVGALLTINGNISFGVIVAFMLYVRLFTSPLSQIAQGMTSLQSTCAAAERVFEFVEEDEMEDEKHLKKKLITLVTSLSSNKTVSAKLLASSPT